MNRTDISSYLRICVTQLIVFSSVLCVAQSFPDKPSLFLDCQLNCHTRYIKEQINFVNYVNDRQVADIYILATSQRAAAGTREVQLSVIGNGPYEGMVDTLVFYYEANVSDAADRELLEANLKKALLPYLVKSGLSEKIDYSVTVSNDENAQEEDLPDPWKYWSFNIGANMNYAAEESNNEIDVGGRLSAQRVTEKEKILFLPDTIMNVPSSKFLIVMMWRVS